MSISQTTLSVALSGYSITNVLRTSIVTPASMTNIVAPGPNKSNRIILWCEREAMEVLSVTTTTAKVVRAVLGNRVGLSRCRRSDLRRPRAGFLGVQPGREPRPGLGNLFQQDGQAGNRERRRSDRYRHLDSGATPPGTHRWHSNGGGQLHASQSSGPHRRPTGLRPTLHRAEF